ncbi:hypothetical protein J437_LFUL008988 [Ladona fulva]|uniref:Uncharacterized protein n=1 Tax=Ladona fulva TaxID=123851 RepID=A0A8K0P045_LADFU|nr:hypothetical protein J437_LFUL008988 [Ladona fulva]
MYDLNASSIVSGDASTANIAKVSMPASKRALAHCPSIIGKRIKSQSSLLMPNCKRFITCFGALIFKDPLMALTMNLSSTPTNSPTRCMLGESNCHMFSMRNQSRVFQSLLSTEGIQSSNMPLSRFSRKMLLLKSSSIYKRDMKKRLYVERSNLREFFQLHSYVTENTKNRLAQNNVMIAVIPGGLTSILQPLDISLNKPFKLFIHA